MSCDVLMLIHRGIKKTLLQQIGPISQHIISCEIEYRSEISTLYMYVRAV